MEFSSLSMSFNKTLVISVRKQNGIYFTPKTARVKLFEKLRDLGITNPSSVLEPSFGSGEFIDDIQTIFPDAEVFGVELHDNLYTSVFNKQTSDKVHLVHSDFLEYSSLDKVDLIVGNPPFFVTKLKNSFCMSGRGNMYVLFLYKCLTQHLKKDGVLAFILPTSFYNCSYYEKCRKYIKDNCSILLVENLEASYHKTLQDTMLIIIKKEPSNENAYFIFKGGKNYINPYYKELKLLLEKSVSLSSMGFKVKTGEITWNEHKSKLSSNGTLLIYQSNIVKDQFVLGNTGKGKQQYIKGLEIPVTKGPAILLPRGYGNSYKFAYALIPNGTEFYGENHVNVIYKDNNGSRNEDQDNDIEVIVKSFNDSRTVKFIEYFIGNGALSKSEIECVFPIFI